MSKNSDPRENQSPEQRLMELGLQLPEPRTPGGVYLPYRISGKWLYLSGQVPRDAQGARRRGRVGREVTTEEARADARNVGLQLLGIAKAAIGDLSQIVAVVKLLGMVNAVPEFEDHPTVINGCSELLVQVLGAVGQHARSAVGVGSLPGMAPLEIEAILELR